MAVAINGRFYAYHCACCRMIFRGLFCLSVHVRRNHRVNLPQPSRPPPSEFGHVGHPSRWTKG